jgi:hypothetical protein
MCNSNIHGKEGQILGGMAHQQTSKQTKQEVHVH